jgi:ATP-dependent DNA helicase RecQ
VQVRVFTLAFSDAVGGFPDEVVRQFLADKRVLEVNDHLFTRAGSPYLALVVKFEGGASTAPVVAARGKPGRDRAPDEGVTLREADWPVFKALKTWRSERSRKDGVPPYVVATNRVLSEIAASRPQTKTALGTIAGFGEAKVARYGDELLALVPPAAAAPVPAAATTTSSASVPATAGAAP